jgi:hypothetical protein
MVEKFANFAQSTLAAAINASQTTLTVSSASSFPLSGNFRVVVQSFDLSTGAPTSAPEIMIVTAVAGNNFTVTRGAESTAAIAFGAGAKVTHIITAGVMQALSSAGVSSLNSLTGTLSLTSTGNTITITPSGSTINLESTGGGGGSGTVTSVSVTSVNGFAGTVTNPTTTPAISISTSVTGILKGNGTAISAATAGTDYQNPITLTTTGTSGAATFVGNTLNIPQYAGTITSVTASSPLASSGGSTPNISLTGTVPAANVGAAGSSGQLQYNNSGVLGGTAAATYSTSGNLVTVTAQSATDVPLILKGATSQTGDFLECKDSSNNNVVILSPASPYITVSANSGLFQMTDKLIQHRYTADTAGYYRWEINRDLYAVSGFTGARFRECAIATLNQTELRFYTGGTTSSYGGLGLYIDASQNSWFSGRLGIGMTSVPTPQFQSVCASSTTIGAVIQGAASQTADLQDWNNNSGTTLASISSTGALTCAGASLGTVSSGTWNGSVIGSSYGGAGTVNGILKANGSGTVSAATSGTDYQAPITLTTTGSSGAATFVGNTLNIPQYSGGGGGGTVTTLSVVSANGFAGTVSNPTTTPAITLTTSITGVLKGNGTAISAASAGTDYQAPITLTTTGTSGAATFTSNTLNIPQYSGGGGGTSLGTTYAIASGNLVF